MLFYQIHLDDIQPLLESDRDSQLARILPAQSTSTKMKSHENQRLAANSYWLIPEKLIQTEPHDFSDQRSRAIPFHENRIRIANIEAASVYFPRVHPTFQPDDSLATMLGGRRLLLDEVLAEFPLELIHEHACHGYIHYQASLITAENGPFQKQSQCVRCGNEDPFLFAELTCARCQSVCTYCRACIMMGKTSSCSPLLTWHGKPKQFTEEPVLGWEGQLSPAQERAATALQEQLFMQMDTRSIVDAPTQANAGDPETLPLANPNLPKKGLTRTVPASLPNLSKKGLARTVPTSPSYFMVWAVCGAGKTEMLFPAILQALQQGEPLLIATPRTDVVLELQPRLKNAFPNTTIQALYGGTEERYSQAQITIATTHQALRYHHHFPTTIIDEVDAFPYSYDKKLQHAIENARTPNSLTIYVTATPTHEMKHAAQTGSLPHVKIPRRYHGYDLPVPKIKWVGNWKRKLAKKQLPFSLISWLHTHLEHDKQIFLFVPRINVIPTVVTALESLFPSLKIEGVHASDPERHTKISQFRKGDTLILVTTTILERGVTVKGVQVAVLGAEDRIFTESALVQIAGRVGRSPEQPTGDIIFYHYGKTNAIVAAIRHINEMNQEPLDGSGKERGD